LLVRGELIKNTENLDVASEAIVIDSSIMIAIVAIPLIVILFIIMINIRKRKRGES
jgi:heme/copper-type cytochrome/quinol oxidase subunit 2